MCAIFFHARVSHERHMHALRERIHVLSSQFWEQHRAGGAISPHGFVVEWWIK
jgi:hypothetical protein